jgi:phasin family protein
MTEKNPAQSFMDMFSKLGQDLNVPKVDVERLMAHHRKNLEALEQSAKVAAGGANAVLAKQREIVEKSLRDLTDQLKGFTLQGNPQDILSKHADFTRKSFEAAIQNTKDVAELVQKSSGDAYRIIQSRMQESVEEIRDAFDKRK